jgi:hypothetical protein
LLPILDLKPLAGRQVLPCASWQFNDRSKCALQIILDPNIDYFLSWQVCKPIENICTSGLQLTILLLR